jgi:hypothetical protein
LAAKVKSKNVWGVGAKNSGKVTETRSVALLSGK